MSEDIEVRLLSERDLRDRFKCGENKLDHFFRRWALDHQRKKLSATWVAVQAGRIVGFATVVASSFPSERLEGIAPGVSPYPVPVLLLARMATSKNLQGKGAVGPALLHHAVFETARGMAASVGLPVGCFGILVDAKSERAARFYGKHGFVRLPADPPEDGRDPTIPMFLLLDRIGGGE